MIYDIYIMYDVLYDNMIPYHTPSYTIPSTVLRIAFAFIIIINNIFVI